jgi:ferredoxin-NADP reductase
MEKVLVATELMARSWPTPGILEVRLRRPAGFTFLPGQFISFVMQGYERDYTMISAPDAATLDFCIALTDEGRFSRDIQKAPIGTPFQCSGPHGHFVFQGPANPPVFVATGTGVAPFVAFCRSGAVPVLLLHGVGAPERLVYQDLLQDACRDYVACISRPCGNMERLENVFPGRVTHYLERQLEPGIYDFYLCGRRSMIRDATALVDERFRGSRLFMEPYD